MFGLIDCNNFFASCERVFNPSLRNVPIAVLSNNDGCVIARSDEVKALGVKMGAPYFEIEELVKKGHIQVFSSNYSLYGDMSNRVMSMLGSYAPEVEIYSIDEAFLHLEGFDTFSSLKDFGHKIVKEVHRGTGIPVSLGVASTKTLAKIANHYAKKNKALTKGYFVLDSPEKTEEILKLTPIGDVWGIGRRYAKFLNSKSITSAYDFTQASPAWVRREMSVVGLRTWKELRGESCIDLEEMPMAKKSICTSRSFGHMLTELVDIEQAVAYYASACARKLRKQKSCAATLQVFLQTNPFRNDLTQYSPSIAIQLPVASSDSMEITHYALRGLKQIFKAGYSYKKAGIIVSNIIPQSHVQGNLFDTIDREKRFKLMKIIDVINQKNGSEKIRLASHGFDRYWINRREKLSPNYTTSLRELIVVK